MSSSPIELLARRDDGVRRHRALVRICVLGGLLFVIAVGSALLPTAAHPWIWLPILIVNFSLIRRLASPVATVLPESWRGVAEWLRVRDDNRT